MGSGSACMERTDTSRSCLSLNTHNLGGAVPDGDAGDVDRARDQGVAARPAAGAPAALERPRGPSQDELLQRQACPAPGVAPGDPASRGEPPGPRGTLGYRYW